jgi:hypothetical protein
MTRTIARLWPAVLLALGAVGAGTTAAVLSIGPAPTALLAAAAALWYAADHLADHLTSKDPR